MSKKKNCPNKNCVGGVITFDGATGRDCKKCNPTKKKLDKYLWHEALDRTALVADHIDRHLLEHPVFNQKDSVRHIQLRKRLEKALDLIVETYTEIGDLSL
jgi:hypothetical protein